MRLWDITTPEYFATMTAHEGTAYGVKFSADGRRALSASGDTTIRLWDVATLETIQLFGTIGNEDPEPGHTSLVLSADFSPDEQTIVSVSQDKTVWLWDVATGKLLKTFLADNPDTAEVLEGHSDVVWTVACHPDGKHVISAGFDKRAILWDTETGAIVHVFEGHTDGITAVAITRDGRYLFIGSWDRLVIQWEIDTGTEVRRFAAHTGWIWAVELTPDETMLMSASTDQKMILWDVATGNIVRQYLGHNDSVLSTAFSPDGKRVVSSGHDYLVILWDVDTATPMRKFTGHTNRVRSIDFSPDGKTLMTGSQDRTVKLWNVQTQEDLLAWTHTNRYVREITCAERDRYRVLTLCDAETANQVDLTTSGNLTMQR